MAAVLGPEDLDGVLGDARAELARLVPELGAPAPGPVTTSPARLFELLLGVLERLAERGPVLLLVEDLHWADRSTRDLLGYLVRNLRAGVVLVLTYRSDDLHRRHPLRPFLAELDRGRRVERLELAPLGRRELAGLIAGILGHRPSSRLGGGGGDRVRAARRIGHPPDPAGPPGDACCTRQHVDTCNEGGAVMAEEAKPDTFPGLSHVAITVTDLAVSAPWYERLFGRSPVLDEDAGSFYHIVYALPGGMLFGLHDNHRAANGDRFDELRPGLDHISFACADRGELEAWQARLEELGIPHSAIKDASYGSGLSFRDPDNIALEFFAPPS
jgi:catechol 2,3-dioxygenase-like lactoylglutathione lyase family enzyme